MYNNIDLITLTKSIYKQNKVKPSIKFEYKKPT